MSFFKSFFKKPLKTVKELNEEFTRQYDEIVEAQEKIVSDRQIKIDNLEAERVAAEAEAKTAKAISEKLADFFKV